MAPKKVPNKQIIKLSKEILKRYPNTFAEEIGIDLSHGDPNALFQWLCASLLISDRINHEIAIKSARALLNEGWNTPEKMNESNWNDRQKVLENSGFTHYKETAATRLGDTAELVIKKYSGDLNNLYDRYNGDLLEIHNALQEFHGIGDIGADIFCREVQLVWPNLYPFLDDKARDYAQELGMPQDAEELTEYCTRSEYPKLITGIVRAGLNDKIEDIKKAA